MTKFSLKDKVVLITGATGYLGSAMVKDLYSCGAKTIVLSTSLSKAQELCSSLDIPAEYAYAIDIADRASAEEVFGRIFKQFKRIDVLVNNAYFGVAKNFYETSKEDWHHAFDGTVVSIDQCVQAVIPFMKKQQHGRIINISSMYGMTIPDPSVYPDINSVNPISYGVGKASINHYTKYAAMMLAGDNITVNSISYGPFPNPDKVKDTEFIKKLSEKTLLKRIGSTEDVASAVYFLSLDESAFVTGQNIVVDGGWTL